MTLINTPPAGEFPAHFFLTFNLKHKEIMSEIIYKGTKIELGYNSENQKSVWFSELENPCENCGFTLAELNIVSETDEGAFEEIKEWIDDREEFFDEMFEE